MQHPVDSQIPKRYAIIKAFHNRRAGSNKGAQCGKLVTSTGFVNKETLAAIPVEAQKVLLEKRPDIFEDLYEETVLAGFGKIDSVISGCWHTEDDDSTIADLARSLGVNLKFTSYTRYCTKEERRG